MHLNSGTVGTQFTPNSPHWLKIWFSAPASQAYVEQIFPVAGILSTGHMDRMKQSLEIATLADQLYVVRQYEDARHDVVGVKPCTHASTRRGS